MHLIIFNVLIRELIKCKMCDALFFNKRAYENHNLFHKSDDVYIENEQQRYEILHNFHTENSHPILKIPISCIL